MSGGSTLPERTGVEGPVLSEPAAPPESPSHKSTLEVSPGMMATTAVVVLVHVC